MEFFNLLQSRIKQGLLVLFNAVYTFMKTKNTDIKRLNRFTTLPVLLDMLQRKRITLLNPKLWEDRNDSEIILAYKQKKDVRNLFAVCMSIDDETVHHWKTFSNGPSGCLIEFSPRKLFEILNNISGIKHGRVNYKTLAHVEKAKSLDIDEMPFTKRWPYRCEKEYRIIYETDEPMDFFEIPIDLGIIRRITISQHMPQQIYNTIKDHLKTVSKNPDGKINRSTLYENQLWINAFKK